jgi:hypothetical protein
VRERGNRNTEQPAALPVAQGVTEQEARALVALVAVRGYAPMACRDVLPYFYAQGADMVERLFAANGYLMELRDWLRLPIPRTSPPPMNPWKHR